jgi:hypothetical protein
MTEHVGLADLYMGFQIETSFVHPSILGAEPYYSVVEGEISLSPEPTQPGTPLRATAMFVGLATRALAAVLEDQNRWVAELADEIQTLTEVELTLPAPFLPPELSDDA